MPIQPPAPDPLWRWVEAWNGAPCELERIRVSHLRQLDGDHALRLLTGPADYFYPYYVPKPESVLVEQQFWFLKARIHA